VRRALAAESGGPELAADLAVSMDNLGRAAEHDGDLAAAEAAFAESLASRRRLWELLGTPESVRDLAISLSNVARVAEARGNWPAAKDAQTEGAALLVVVASIVHTPAAEQEAVEAGRELAALLARRPASRSAGPDAAEGNRISGVGSPEPPAE